MTNIEFELMGYKHLCEQLQRDCRAAERKNWEHMFFGFVAGVAVTGMFWAAWA